MLHDLLKKYSTTIENRVQGQWAAETFIATEEDVKDYKCKLGVEYTFLVAVVDDAKTKKGEVYPKGAWFLFETKK